MKQKNTLCRDVSYVETEWKYKDTVTSLSLLEIGDILWCVFNLKQKYFFFKQVVNKLLFSCLELLRPCLCYL